jgi:hypothetical protein
MTRADQLAQMAQTIAAHAQPLTCWDCGDVLTADDIARDEPLGRLPDFGLCASCDQTESERAHERWLSTYYGGSSPQTDQERQIAARKVT